MPPKAGAGVRFTSRVASGAGGGPRVAISGVPAFGAAGTVEALAKFDPAMPFGVFDTAPSAVGSVRLRYTGTLQWDNGGGPASSPNPPTPPPLTWCHYLITWTGLVMTLYVDGVLVGSYTATGAPPAVGATMHLGAINNVADGDGAVAGFRIWSRALTAAEAAERAAGREVNPSGLVVDLPLDEGVGMKALDRSAAPLYDGTLTNGPTWVQSKAERGMRTGERGQTGTVQVANVGIIAQPARAETILCWAKLTDVPPNTSVYPTLFGTETANVWDYRLDSPVSGSGQIHRSGMSSGAASFSGAPWADRQWHFLALTHDIGGTGQLRVGYDGVTPTLLATITGTPTAQTRLEVGDEAATNRSWPGPIRDFAVFGRVLTDTEIRAVMLGLVKPSDVPGCVLWLPLEGDTLNRAPVGSRKRERLARGGTSTDFSLGVLTGWEADGAVLTPDAATTSMRIASSVVNGGARGFSATRAPVDPGRPVTFSYDAATIGESFDVRARLLFYDAAGVVVGSTESGPATTAFTDRWTRVVVQRTAPLTAATVRAEARIATASGVGTFLMRRPSVLASLATEYVEPSILEPAPAVHGREVNGPRLVRPRARGGVLIKAGAGSTQRVATGAVPAIGNAAAWTGAVWWRPAAMEQGYDMLMTVGEPAALDVTKKFQLRRYGQLGALEVVVGTGAGFAAYLGGFALVKQGVWQSAVVTYDGATLRLYSEGVLIGAAAVASSYGSATSVVHLGARGAAETDYHASGVLADARFWSRALSDDEVAGLMLGLVPAAGLEGEWLTDGSIMGAVALDTSGKGRHGTIVGAVAA